MSRRTYEESSGGAGGRYKKVQKVPWSRLHGPGWGFEPFKPPRPIALVPGDINRIPRGNPPQDLYRGLSSERLYHTSCWIPLPTANTLTAKTMAIPYEIHKDGTATVTEIIKIQLKWATWETAEAATKEVRTQYFQLYVDGPGNDFYLWNEDCILDERIDNDYDSNGTALATYFDYNKWIDFTDGAGNGYIVATKYLTGRFNTANFNNTCSFQWRIYFKIRQIDTPMVCQLKRSDRG